jgi:DNA (cytosine-5)-methyltransferase 1
MIKPPYSVPTMAEVRALPWNGFRVASTFAGGGGSSTGYRMAGFKVVYANEFIPAAQDTYRANMNSSTVLDGRDIRTVTAASILEMAGLKPGELDVLDGSPPCAAFSTAGSREKKWGKVSSYSDSAQRSDDLFFEYARLVRELQPKVFVAENVSGLIKGTAKGYFLEILATLKACGYRVEAKLLDAQWLGVPQARQRLIFIGVRNDLGLSPAYPKPFAYRYSVRDALPWIMAAVHDSYGQWRPVKANSYSKGDITNSPCPCVTVGVNSINSSHYMVEAEADMSRYAVGAEWDKLAPHGRSDKYFQLVRPSLEVPCPTITSLGGVASVASVTHPTEKRKFSIAELRRICSFPDDYVLTGTYAQQWERCGRSVPPIMMAAIAGAVRDGILVKTRGREVAA